MPVRTQSAAVQCKKLSYALILFDSKLTWPGSFGNVDCDALGAAGLAPGHGELTFYREHMTYPEPTEP
jgi:hypothetical protein